MAEEAATIYDCDDRKCGGTMEERISEPMRNKLFSIHSDVEAITMGVEPQVNKTAETKLCSSQVTNLTVHTTESSESQPSVQDENRSQQPVEAKLTGNPEDLSRLATFSKQRTVLRQSNSRSQIRPEAAAAGAVAESHTSSPRRTPERKALTRSVHPPSVANARPSGTQQNDTMSSSQWVCPECGKLMLRKCLYRHLKAVHRKSSEEVLQVREGIDKELGNTRISCPLCSECFTTHNGLARHCGNRHSENGADGRPQNYSIYSMEFNSREEYEQWFAKMCERTSSSLTTDHKETSSKSTKLRLFCNRAGVHRGLATQRAVRTKRDVRHCSCYTVVTFKNDGTIAAEACFGHVGHNLDPALLRFTQQQRIYLKNLLEEHTMDYIINRLRREDPTKSSKLAFVVKADLRNIATKYHMIPGWRHKDDLISLRMRFEEKNAEDGIRCLSLPKDSSGQGFLSVIITPLMLEWMRKYSSKGVTLDDTFHTTRYSLKLATLMVADEKDRGLPGAFLLSGSMTSVDVERLFMEIKYLLPNFSPEIIVTDEAPCFYKGYSAVFPNSRTRLRYCSFHIRQTWERKTKELVEGSVRPAVNKALRDLLKEVQRERFEVRFAEILVFLRRKGQNLMADYLERNYLGRVPSWALFTNTDAIFDTTMISERFHLRIKEEFLHRNANSRLDGFVDLLIKSVEDMSDSMEVKDRRRFASSAYRLEETHKMHRIAATRYRGRDDLLKRVAENTWELRCITTATVFKVSFSEACSCHPTKNTHCIICGVCAYSWNCTCLDTKSGVSCVHRHAVKLFTEDLLELPAPAQEEPMSTHAEANSDAPITVAQERREARYNKLNVIRSTYAVVDTIATSLAKLDTDEAMSKLDTILKYLELAAAVHSPSSATLSVRPELVASGSKLQLSKISLHQRGKIKKPKKVVFQDLHEQIRQERRASL